MAIRRTAIRRTRIIHVNWGYCLTEMGRYRLLAACVLLAIASVNPGSGEADCGSPPAVSNAAVATSNGTLDGSTVTYTCDGGFGLVSGDATLTCENGTWTGTPPTCAADCGSPPAVSSASVATSNGTLEGSTATYTCASGFGLASGDTTLTCVNETWTGTPPTCAADCGSPPAVSNAAVATSNGTLEGSTATYTCDSGFGLASGDATLTCVNGVWTGTPPTCAADCGSPPAVSDATVATPNGTLDGSAATYTCASGFGLASGDTTLTCVNGVWTRTPPTCATDCGSPPAVSDATVATPNGTLDGSAATYTCASGFGLASGDATLTCVNGVWTGTPPTCATDCGSPPAVSDATVATPNGTLDGSTATYTCDSGFGLASGDATLTCVNGTWTGTPPTCAVVMIGLELTDSTVVEGDPVMVTVRAMLGGVTLDRDVVVTVMTVDGTATGGDYTAVSVDLTFNSSRLSHTVTVYTLVDMEAREGNETFSISLSNSAAQLSVPTATITIRDATVALGFSRTAYAFAEGEMMTNVEISVAANPQSRSVDVTVRSVNDTATSGGDFAAVDQAISITPGETTYMVPVTIYQDKEVEDVEESFSLSLSTEASGVAISPMTAYISITDTTIQIGLNVTEYSVAEGESFTVTVAVVGSPDISGDITVNLSTSSPDIDLTSENFTFNSSVRSQTVSILARIDMEVEGEERVSISLTNSAPNVALEPASADIVIVDRTVFVQEAPQPQGVLLGGPANMTCVIAAGFNITTVLWSRDDTTISDNHRITTTLTQPSDGVGIYSSQLTIDPVMFDDCGVYTCSAIGVSSPTVNSSAALSVVDLNSTSDPNPVSSVGAIGQLSCTILSCGEPFSIEWDVFKDNMTADIMPAEASSVVDNLTRLMSVVTIDTLGLRNNGEKQHCRVTYDGEDVTSQVFNYTLQNVEVSLTVYPERSGSFIEGENVTLTCNATNPPNVSASLTFVWGRSTNSEGSQPLMTNERFTIMHEADYSILLLMNIQDDSVNVEGTYLCRVYNRLIADSVIEMIDIDVISGPVVEFPSMRGGGSRVTVGYNLTVTCDTGRSKPRVTSVVISSGGVVLESTDGSSTSITITNPTLENNGTVYVCTAVNAIGNTSRNFSLIVQDRPAMVDITTLSSTLLSLLVATVSWTPPADNNSPITLYNISVCTLTNSTCSNVENFPSLVPYLLLEVVPTYQYNVTVTATNDIGSSDTSDVGMVFGAVNSDSLVSLHTSLVTDTLVILEWTLPPLATTPDMIPRPESNFTVTGYSLSMNMERDTFVSLDHDITSHLFNNLNDRRTIMFTVEVFYSDSRINGNLERITILSVTIPSRGAVPPLAMAPAAPVVPTSSGFTISWNVPEVNTDFLTGYEITIKVASSRRKRLADGGIVRNVSQTNFPFIDGKPFTNYITSVDGLLSVNEVPGRVVALVATPVRTAEAASSPPQNLQQADIGITSVTVRWDLPLEPNGIISGYQVAVAPSTESSPLSVSGITAIVDGLRGNTNYSVTVRAVNGAGDGNLSQPLSITTNLGVYPPEIADVAPNENTGQYTLRINRFKTDFGDISHYFIYVVETDSSPDTSTITDTDLQGAYIAVAADVPTSTSSLAVVIGTGNTIKYNNRDYTNRAVTRGTSYYFFVRLYSSVNPAVFNDSTPHGPNSLLKRETEEDEMDVVAIIAGVLGALAFVLIIVFIALVIFAVCGKRVKKHTFPRRHEDGGEKDNILLRRRTRLFTPVLEVGEPSVFTSAGQPTTLVCEVSGTPAPTVKWTHEGKPLEDERFLVLADHSLFIQDTCLEDEGSYLVTAENSAGISQAQIKVTVIKPTPPEPDKDHPPVPVDNFTEHFARMSANDGDDLEDEYGEAEPEFVSTSHAAKLSLNRNKNRYVNIIPYDHSRVVLPLQENTPGSDYVNASYIDGYKRANQYIASQGPTTSTLADFWRMVWEFDCPTIVMVTKLEEEDKKKCEQYWPSYGSTTYGNVQVTLKEAENLAEYSIRTFTVSPLAGQSSAQMPVREVKQFHFLKWPDHGVPNYATALLHFRKRVHQYHPEKRGPMVIHCSAGVGRTGTFITVDYCMEQMDGEGIVDIFNFVRQMRYKRNYMVQTPPQYEFLHVAIHEAITCGDTSVKAPELKEWLTKLEPDPETGKNVMEAQFQQLESASPHDDDFDCTVAEVNKDKNRTQKHLPSNDQRVILSSENDLSDYICASYVDGYRQRNAFMITQGPMENTVGDFWRMVWELKSAAIVMLTQLEEDGEEMSKKYWSDEVGEAVVFGMFHVELTSEVRELGDYCTRKIKLSPIDKPHESRIVTQFHFTKWSRSIPPDSAKTMIDMIDELQRVQRKSGNQPITVHCSDGLGRTGTFCTLYYVLDRVKTEQVVDVFQAVKTLRIQRTGLVENVGQYLFVHKATTEFLDTFSDYQNFKA